jgi:aryl-alcohol dehydrogenase-like predicted oxidoreductase
MHYRALGATGLELSEIGFGCGDNAGLMIAGSFAEQCAIVARALELGVNYFDTAAGYGSTRSEEAVGKVLKELGARPIINTKVEITLEQTADVASAVVASVEASLRRLQIEQVDIVEIHNSPVHKRPESFTGWLPMLLHEYLGRSGALEGLERLKAAGKVRFFGLVNERPDVDLARALIDTGAFSIINVQYNLINPTAGMPLPEGLEVSLDNDNILGYAAEHGVGTAIFSPLARGVLTQKSVADGWRHPLAGEGILRDQAAYDAQLGRGRSLMFLANRERTLSQAAIRFILMHPGVTVVLGGFSAMEHLEEMAAVPEIPPLSSDELKSLHRLWQSNFVAA